MYSRFRNRAQFVGAVGEGALDCTDRERARAVGSGQEIEREICMYVCV